MYRRDTIADMISECRAINDWIALDFFRDSIIKALAQEREYFVKRTRIDAPSAVFPQFYRDRVTHFNDDLQLWTKDIPEYLVSIKPFVLEYFTKGAWEQEDLRKLNEIGVTLNGMHDEIGVLQTQHQVFRPFDYRAAKSQRINGIFDREMETHSHRETRQLLLSTGIEPAQFAKYEAAIPTYKDLHNGKNIRRSYLIIDAKDDFYQQ